MQPTAPQGYGSSNPYPHTAPAAHSFDGSAPAEQVSEATVQLLHQTRPWVLFFSVIMFLGSAFSLLNGTITLCILGSRGGYGVSPGLLMVFVYVPMSVLYVYPAKKLYGYGTAIGRLTASRQVSDLEAALGEQKAYWKFLGILTIVCCVCLLGFLAVAGIFFGSVIR